MRPDYLVISWDHFEFSLLFTRGINRGYYVAAQRHEISLRVLKNISRVIPPFELFYDEFKVIRCCTKTLCLCWVLRSKIAFMRYVTFSNLLYVFGLIRNNKLGHFYIPAWVSRFASVTEIIKYVEKLLAFACTTVLPSEFFWQTKFFPRAEVLCLVKCDKGRFSSSVFTSWRKP